ncbi:hypothetical protein BC826DRAFT_1173940 [Russula brevipes]|nr:hypothetical protein BC826DRAFT_1173940 [Russula brevipes]
MSSSSPFLDTPRPRPMPYTPARLLSTLKRPFSKSRPEPIPILPDRDREPGPGATPPSYEQIAMGLHLSRTPHFPAYLAHLHPPSQQPRLQRSVSSPGSASQRVRPASAHHPRSHMQSRSHSSSPTPSQSPPRTHSRLPPPPARSALKKPRAKATGTSSSVTPDTASASTVASSVLPPTPTRSSARSGLLARLLGKERGAASPLVAIVAESEPEPERKAVRFRGLKEEDEPS